MTTVTVQVTTPKIRWRKIQQFTVSKVLETVYESNKFLRLAHDALRHGYRFKVISIKGDELLEDAITEIEFPGHLGPAQYEEDRSWKYFSEVRN